MGKMNVVVTRSITPVPLMFLNRCCFMRHVTNAGMNTADLDVPAHSELYEEFSRVCGITLPSDELYAWDTIAFQVPDSSNIFIVGDSSGQATLSFSRRKECSMIHPHSLTEFSKAIPQDLVCFRPYLSRRLSNVSTKFQENTPDNIDSPLWKMSINHELSSLDRSDVLFVFNCISTVGDIMYCLTWLDNKTNVLLRFPIRLLSEPLLLDNLEDLMVMVTPFDFHEIGNCYLFGRIASRSKKVKGPDLKLALTKVLSDMYQQVEPSLIPEITDLITQDYIAAWSSSINLSLSHCISLGFMIPLEHLSMAADKLLVWVLRSINLNYKFPEDRQLVRDHRVMSVNMVWRLSRLVKIVLLAISDLPLENSLWFNDLALVRQRYQHQGVTRSKIELGVPHWRFLSHMKETDYLTDICIKSFHRINHPDQKPILFSSVQDLIRYVIVPGMKKMRLEKIQCRTDDLGSFHGNR